MAFDRGAMRQQVVQSVQTSVDRNNTFPGSSSGYLDNSKLHDRPIWMVKEGQHVIDIIPSQLSADFGVSGVYSKGNYVHGLEVEVHRNVGVNKSSVVCPRMFGHRCPICDLFDQLRAEGQAYENIKNLRPSRRMIYCVWVHDREKVEEAKGVQILEISHFQFENKINAINRDPRTGELIIFADPDDGRSLAFQKIKGTGKFAEITGYQFLSRPAPIPDAICEQAAMVHLNELPKELSYETIVEIMNGGAATDAGAQAGQSPVYPQQQVPVYGQQPAAYGTIPETVPGADPFGAAQAPAAPQYVTPPSAPSYVAAAPIAPVPPQPVVPSGNNANCLAASVGGQFGVTTDAYNICSDCTVWGACTQAKAAQTPSTN